MSHWIFLRVYVSIRKGPSSGYQTKAIEHKTKLADLVICGFGSITRWWSPSDGIMYKRPVWHYITKI